MNDSDTDTPSGSPAAAAEPTLDEDVRMLRALASLLGFFAWNSRYVKFCDGLAQRLATERAAAQRDARRLDWLENTLDPDDEGDETTLWLDFEVPDGAKPTFAISGALAGNQRGATLREAIDAGIAKDQVIAAALPTPAAPPVEVPDAGT